MRSICWRWLAPYACRTFLVLQGISLLLCRRSTAPSQRKLRVQASSTGLTVELALATCKEAAATSRVPPAEVFAAMRVLEKDKASPEDWGELLGGGGSPGKRWRLVFTSGTKDVQEALKGVGKGKSCCACRTDEFSMLWSSHVLFQNVPVWHDREHKLMPPHYSSTLHTISHPHCAGGGKYFPLTAVQRWDAAAGEIENGIFLGHLAALLFKGPYSFSGKKLGFDFDTLVIKLGPKFEFPLKSKIDRASYKPTSKDPFFIFVYVDDDICVARGRGGGIAMWARTSPKWELENGVV
jgi:hypothetical protein